MTGHEALNPIHPSVLPHLDPVFIDLYNTHVANTPNKPIDLGILRSKYSVLYSYGTGPSPEPEKIYDAEVPGHNGDMIPVRVYNPHIEGPWAVHVDFHGGGWGLGDLDTESHICKHLAVKANVCVIDVGYRLVPEHAFPIGIQDSIDAKPGEFEEKLLLPAIRGTTAACEAAAEHECVKKVVIMSSFAAVYDAAKGPQPGKVCTEEDWSPLTYEDGKDATMVPIAYRASKVLAEKAAWDFVESHDVHYKLVTLCPGMVFGRMIHPIESLEQLNASNQIVWEVLRQKDCIPPTRAPVWVDVDDLAIISLKALTVDLISHERFLLTAGAYDTQEIADTVRAALPERQDRIAVGEPGKRIRETHYSCDASKVQRVLGVEFRALEESLIPLARQLYEMAETRY